MESLDECPRRPLREHNTAHLNPATAHEIAMAVRDMAEGQAPGPDGVPVEMRENSAVILRAVASMSDSLMRGGNLLTSLLLINVVPLLKQGEDTRKCASRRPISFLSVMQSKYLKQFHIIV